MLFHIWGDNMIKCPAISERLYGAMWNKLSHNDFDRKNKTDRKLLEYLGWSKYKREKLKHRR